MCTLHMLDMKVVYHVGVDVRTGGHLLHVHARPRIKETPPLRQSYDRHRAVPTLRQCYKQ